jgi:hypothetical protein
MRTFPGFLAALLLVPLAGCASSTPGPEEGPGAVNLTPVTFAGLQETLAQLKGKVVVLAFWASY